MNTKTQLIYPISICAVLAVATFVVASSCRTNGPASGLKDVEAGSSGQKKLLYVLNGSSDPSVAMVCVTGCSDSADFSSVAAARQSCQQDPKGMTLTEFYGKHAAHASQLRRTIDLELKNANPKIVRLSPVALDRLNRQITAEITTPNPACTAVQ
jgi:hypothetical protein